MTRGIREVRGYLRNKINHALRRLGMYGGEISLILLFDALAFADGVDAAWQTEREAMRQQGVFVPTGVHGAFQHVLPDVGRGDDAVASVYAEFAHTVGWLELDRVLTEVEYRDLRSRLEDWCAEDQTIADATRAFGAPSVVLGGTNPLYPKTLLFAAAGQPVVCLHFWNTAAGIGAKGLFDEPILLAARVAGLPFPESVIFTPEGRRRRPEHT